MVKEMGPSERNGLSMRATQVYASMYPEKPAFLGHVPRFGARASGGSLERPERRTSVASYLHTIYVGIERCCLSTNPSLRNKVVAGTDGRRVHEEPRGPPA